VETDSNIIKEANEKLAKARNKAAFLDELQLIYDLIIIEKF
jgi:hypothetical protein